MSEENHPWRRMNMGDHLKAAHEAGTKLAAAEMLLEAANIELNAALTSGDWEHADKARETCVSRFEAVLDLKVSSVRKLREMGNPFG